MAECDSRPREVSLHPKFSKFEQYPKRGQPLILGYQTDTFRRNSVTPNHEFH